MQDYINRSAKEMFEKLGYVQKMYNADIQYEQVANRSEMQRIGMVSTKQIEFYMRHKEILICTKYEHRSGNKTKSDAGTLTLEEFKAVQKQVNELGWE